jgi:O-antigen ligase
MLGDDPEQGSTIDYRRELLETSLALIRQSPWLGVPNYGAYMEHLRQGEGIIDIVNTYLRVTLDAGLVGLTMFLLPHLIVLTSLAVALGGQGRHQTGQAVDPFVPAFVATILGLLACLLTTSLWFNMPQLLLICIAVAAVWLHMSPNDREQGVNRTDWPVPAGTHMAAAGLPRHAPRGGQETPPRRT